MSASTQLPQPGEAWQGASGGVRVVADVIASPSDRVWFRAEGQGERKSVSLAAWRLWQRTAKRVQKSAKEGA